MFWFISDGAVVMTGPNNQSRAERLKVFHVTDTC